MLGKDRPPPSCTQSFLYPIRLFRSAIAVPQAVTPRACSSADKKHRLHAPHYLVINMDIFESRTIGTWVARRRQPGLRCVALAAVLEAVVRQSAVLE
jgi:hypothetical protein